MGLRMVCSLFVLYPAFSNFSEMGEELEKIGPFLFF